MSRDSSTGLPRSPATAQADSSPEAPVIPDHELLRRIGKGSYGEVWLVRSVTGIYRAAKVVYRQTFDCDRPYEREFEGTKKFEPFSRSHESQVDILHVGHNEAAGYFYYVMELADNANVDSEIGGDRARIADPNHYVPKTLRSELRQHGRLPVQRCLQIAVGLTTALEYLHKSGLVHRDVKPSNIIFVNGHAKLADIGLVTDSEATLSFVGTEGYCPAEGPGTPQSDLYSLGKVIYEMSSGRDRRDYPELPLDFDAMAERDDWLELNAVFSKACVKDAHDRYPSAGAMRADLLLLQSGKSVKRVRGLEKALARLKKFGVAAAAAILLSTAGLLYQQNQARRFQALAEEHRNHLVRSHVANGVRFMEEGDLPASLVWFVEALKLDRGDPQREAMHRYRIEAVLRHCPKLVQWGSHSNLIHYAEFSRDGREIVTASADGTAQVWNPETGQPVIPPLTHGKDVQWAYFNPDSSRVVTISDDAEARVWDAKTGALACPPLRHDAMVQSVAYSPDGHLLATASDDHTAQVWDAATGQRVGPPIRHNAGVNVAVFNADGQQVITGARGNLARVWNATNAAPVSPPLVHPREVVDAAFSPNGQCVATACDDGAARVWEVATGRAITPPLRHSSNSRHVVFSRDGLRLLSSGGYQGRQGEAIVWDATTGEMLVPPLRHGASVYDCFFTPDERWILTASSDATARLWHAETGELLALLRQHTAIRNATLSPDGRQVLTSGRDGIWRVWDMANAVSHSLVLRFNSAVLHAEFSPDGLRLLTVDRTSAMVWNAFSGEPLTPKLRDAGRVDFARFSPAGKRVALPLRNGAARLFDAVNGEEILLEPMRHAGAVRHLAFTHDGRLLATGSADRTARIWDTSTGQPVTPTLPHDFPVHCVEFSPDGTKLATGSGVGESEMGPGEVRIWRVRDGQLAAPPLRMEAAVPRVAFSPDGRRLVAACADFAPVPRSARLADALSGEPMGEPLRHGQAVTRVAWSREGSLVATGSSDGTARVWDAATGSAVTPLLRHQRGIQCVTFSPDGKRLATASADGTARVWDTQTGEPITPALRHAVVKRFAREGWLHSVAFSPDGQRLVTAGGTLNSDGEVHVWDLLASTRTVDDLERIAHFMSGAHLDHLAGLNALTTDQLRLLWEHVRPTYPDLFSVSTEEMTAWHQQQAAECEHKRQWFAARFHLVILSKLQPANTGVAARLARAKAELDEAPAGTGGM